MKEKIKNLSSNLNDEEAALLFYLLLQSFETANYQKVEYQNKDLIGEQFLMINVELETKNVSPTVVQKLLGLLK